VRAQKKLMITQRKGPKMDIFFMGNVNSGGYACDEDGMIRPIRPNAKSTLEVFSRQTTLNFLDLALGYPMHTQRQVTVEEFQSEEQRFMQGAVEFTNKYGLLFFDTEANPTPLSDYATLASRISVCEQRGRSELGDLIDNRFSGSLIERYDPEDDYKPYMSIETDNLSQAIWLDYVLNGTGGFQRCEYFRRYGPRKKNKCSQWMEVTYKGQIWCSDACRVAAVYQKKKEKGAKK
jgi:hypothetical protein